MSWAPCSGVRTPHHHRHELLGHILAGKNIFLKSILKLIWFINNTRSLVIALFVEYLTASLNPILISN